MELHVDYVKQKGKQLTHKIKTIVRLTWGFKGRSLDRVYEGAIQPAMSYATPVWAKDLKVRQRRKLLSAQRVLAIKTAVFRGGASFRATNSHRYIFAGSSREAANL